MSNENLPSNEVNKIIRFHEEAKTNLANAIHCAIQAGKELQKVKEKLTYGAFGAWIESNLPFDARTAQRYMKIAENEATIIEVDPSSLSEAYALTEKPKEKVVDDFPGEFSDEDDDEDVITVDAGAAPSIDYGYWRSFERIVKIMDAEYLKLASSRDHTTAKALGFAIGNIKDMSLRIGAWEPGALFDCPHCGGSGQVEDSNGQMATCSICVAGRVGPFKESKY